MFSARIEIVISLLDLILTDIRLYDYRKRIATYRTDLDLLASHQNFPWIPVWDDHGKIISVHPSGVFLPPFPSN